MSVIDYAREQLAEMLDLIDRPGGQASALEERNMPHSSNPLASLIVPGVTVRQGEPFPAGCFRRRKAGSQVRCLVLHWGGFDVGHCRRALANRGLSSHGGIGPGFVELWVPPGLRAYHAGTPANDWSVGFDICQSPELRHLAQCKKRGMNAAPGDNPTGRGPDRCLMPDPRIAATARAFVPAVCGALGIPLRVPRGPNGIADDGPVYHGTIDREAWLELGGGVLGHHHLSKTKWDIAPWWEVIFHGTALG